jgi:diguanylate cyclase (GGDEF)-like protein
MYSDPEVCIDDLSTVIGADPALTARIVKFANSASFARAHAATSLKQAIMVLGASGVKLMALSFSLTETGKCESNQCFSYEDFWRSSLATAVSAKAIFKAVGEDEETGFLLGLLMNVGQIAMANGEPESYQALLGDAESNAPELIAKETETFGINRYELAFEVLSAMGFPDSIANSLNLANDESCIAGASVKSRGMALANQMSFLFLAKSPAPETVRSFANELSELTGFEADESELLYDSTLQSYAEVASVLAYTGPSKKSLGEIELEAKKSIIEMSMALQAANSEVQRENNELKSIAYYDALSGLGNRRQYDSMLEAEIDRSSRMGRPLSLVIIDIDFFKKVNDTYGHAAGDAVIAGVAARLNLHIRNYDFLFRIGGEEFALILPESKEEECQLVSERLRKSIAAEPFEFGSEAISVTISMGGTIYFPSSITTSDELFKRADKNLYLAKKAGRNQIILGETKTDS